MALKGTTRIELTNVKTGQKEIIEKDNLVTNALRDLLTGNPFMQQHSGMSYPSYMHQNVSLPVCPNLAGGILLYEDALDEDADKYYAASDNNLVGYSSNDVVTTDDPRRGSLNQSESGALEDGSGYRFVFDFATSQANGTISGVGLTSKWGGLEGYGAVQGSSDGAGIQRIKTGLSRAIDSSTNAYYKSLFNAICMIDGDKNIGYAALLTGDHSVTVASYRLNISTISLVGNIAVPGILEETVLETKTFGTYASNQYIAFVNDGKGYIWGLQYVDNKQYVPSGDAVINWVKINPTDWSFTEGTWTFALPLQSLGYQKDIELVGSYKLSYVIIHEDYLYIFSYDKLTVYKINLNNITDVTPIQFEDKSLMWTSFSSYRKQSCVFNLVGNVIIFPGGYIIGDTAVKAAASSDQDNDAYGLASCSAPAMKWGPYLFTMYRSTYTSSTPSIQACLMTPYLATINNLPTPVEKTADKTMKITYILREES